MLLAQHGYFGFADRFGLKVLILGDSISRGNSTALGPFTRATQWDDANSTIISIDDNDLLEPVAAGGGGSQWPAFANEIYARSGRNTTFCNTGIGGSAWRYDLDANLSWYTGHNLWTNSVTKARRWLSYIGRPNPDLVVISMGINDVNKSPMTTTLADMQNLIDRINTEYSTPRIFVVLVGASSTLLTNYELNDNLGTMSQNLKQLAENNTNVEVSCSHREYITWGLMQGDGVHLTATGNTVFGERLARHFLINPSLITNKIARSWISMFWDDPSNTRRLALNTFADGAQSGGYWERLDALHLITNMGSADALNGWRNASFCWAFGANGSVNDPANDIQYDGFRALAANTDNWFEGQYTIIANRATLLSDFVAGAFIGDNTTGSGTVAAIFGTRESAAGGIIICRQSGGGAIEWCSCDGTVDSNASEGAFADNSHYWVARSSGGTNNKHLGKNGSVVATVTRASLAMSPGGNLRAARYASYNNNGSLTNHISCAIRASYFAKYDGWNASGWDTLMSNFLTDWLVNTP